MPESLAELNTARDISLSSSVHNEEVVGVVVDRVDFVTGVVVDKADQVVDVLVNRDDKDVGVDAGSVDQVAVCRFDEVVDVEGGR